MSEYSMLHKHSADEINLIVSENSKLKYEIQLGDETYKVSSPSTVFIPKGVRHKAKFISGKGIFVCIILSGKYKSSK
uniref:Isopropylmalate/homocitrate/citramalate synthase family protein n=1 Tax=uncultured marine thaumarchaeote KM3_88_G03 TaxID=1456337 RepID=A0A075HXC5_9ARCH|nr:Isopropylmalate/homocitrate/citramalate synthase family protein [uncultured marine thaumarchaeote KM3_88_G03]